MGPSGAGKSTLLNIFGCMDKLTSGDYYLQGKNIDKYKKKEEVRGKIISFVFQNFSLLNNYSVYDNIELAITYKKMTKKEKKERILNVMESLDISDLKQKMPTQISGGQQQRVAIARSLVCDSDIILADEPTGSLDQKTGQNFMELLCKANVKGKTIILITHDEAIAKYAQRIIKIIDGKILSN